MDNKKLLDLVQLEMQRTPAILGVELENPEKGLEGSFVAIRFKDLSQEEDESPWVAFASFAPNFTEELFDDRYPVVEVLFRIGKVDTEDKGYIDLVSISVLPFVDHARLTTGVSTRWDPKTGWLTLHSLVRDVGQPEQIFGQQIRNALRSVIAVVYLAQFKKKEITALGSLGKKLAIPILGQLYGEMMAALGIKSKKGPLD